MKKCLSLVYYVKSLYIYIIIEKKLPTVAMSLKTLITKGIEYQFKRKLIVEGTVKFGNS